MGALGLPVLEVDESGESSVSNGRSLYVGIEGVAEGAPVAIVHDGSLIAVYAAFVGIAKPLAVIPGGVSGEEELSARSSTRTRSEPSSPRSSRMRPDRVRETELDYIDDPAELERAENAVHDLDVTPDYGIVSDDWVTVFGPSKKVSRSSTSPDQAQC